MGVAIELKKVSADSLTVERGRATLFGGGPLVQGDTYIENVSGAGVVTTDLSYKINEDGTLKAWSFWQDDDANLPHVVGDIRLVILRRSGSDFTVVGTAEMDRDIISKGAWEFSCEIEVQRNDLVALWIADSTGFKLGAQTDLDGGSGLNLYTWASVANPQTNDNLGPPSGTASAKISTLSVRGAIDDATIEDVENVWEASDDNDDAFSYRQFVSGTDAFPEDVGAATGNINNVANLFDNNTGTVANVATGVTTLNNIYYFLDIGGDTDLVPVERFVIHAPVPPAGGVIRVYGSQDIAQVSPMTLAKAQAVTDWQQIMEFGENVTAAEIQHAMYHIAKKYKWMRLEIVGGSAASTTIGALEFEIMDNAVADGVLSPHPDVALKNRYFFDSDSGQELTAVSAVITRTVLSTDTVVYCEGAAQEFFDQIAINGYVYLRHNVPRASNDVMKRVKVVSKNPTTKTLTLDAQAGEGFQVGDFVDPEVWFFRFRAYDASGNLFAVSNWVGYHSTIPPWIRTHDTYTTDGN